MEGNYIKSTEDEAGHYDEDSFGFYSTAYFYISYYEEGESDSDAEIYRFKVVDRFNGEIAICETRPIDESKNIKIADISSKVPSNVKEKVEVEFDGEDYIVLYDKGEIVNGTKLTGAQLISKNVMENVFKLGYEDLTLPTVAKFGKNIDDDDIDLYLEKAVYSYNHAVDTLNTACSDLVLNDSNKDLVDVVRCVGSNPVSPSDPENFTAFTSDFLEDNPYDDGHYRAGVGNGIGRPEDENYLADYDRMVVLGITQANNVEDNEGWTYWLASRFIYSQSESVDFNMRYIYFDDSCNDHSLASVDSGSAYSDWTGHGLRPVVSLKSKGLSDLVD